MNLSSTDRAFLRGQFGGDFPRLTTLELDELAEALFAEHFENNPAYSWNDSESTSNA